ncbi:hypothetical protein ADN00_02435 [Ornatilinea apprima]|uniref:Nbr1 FW domain-containing protein n=1 Tax=Ornatilinea apprima TaxID=1134406 RepID=A0A0P6Y3Y1_9CHLR|nr:NBR1-Ig-like domain-containing protein [Ornatilinea apprima]KPL79672.1 hypothetical protein ADN00_02435 [Ornatilinea apprima]
MFKKHPWIFLILILALAAFACNFPGAAATLTPTPDPAQQALTLVAQTEQAAAAATLAATQPVITVPPTVTLAPFSGSTPAPASTSTSLPCDQAGFVTDVTIPDGTQLEPNKEFIKTWRLKNTGSCTWTTSYAVVFDSGDAMNAPVSTSLTGSVAPGQTIDISVSMKAPTAEGTYRGNWKLRNASGAVFGLGASNSAFYVEIEVKNTPSSGPTVIYNFAEKYCEAEWISAAGVLACPGGTGDSSGFVIKLSNPKMETGDFANKVSIQTHPQWIDNGAISGRFPAVAVQSGYRFKADIGCLHNGSACDVKYQLNYRVDGGPLQSLGTWGEKYDAALTSLNVDLSSLAGSSVQFILAVQSNGPSNQDWAVWVNPRIEK